MNRPSRTRFRPGPGRRRGEEAEPFAEEEETIPWDLTVESTDFPEETRGRGRGAPTRGEPAPAEEPEAAPEPEPAVAEAAEPAVAQAEPEPIILPVTITLRPRR